MYNPKNFYLTQNLFLLEFEKTLNSIKILVLVSIFMIRDMRLLQYLFLKKGCKFLFTQFA